MNWRNRLQYNSLRYFSNFIFVYKSRALQLTNIHFRVRPFIISSLLFNQTGILHNIILVYKFIYLTLSYSMRKYVFEVEFKVGPFIFFSLFFNQSIEWLLQVAQSQWLFWKIFIRRLTHFLVYIYPEIILLINYEDEIRLIQRNCKNWNSNQYREIAWIFTC